MKTSQKGVDLIKRHEGCKLVSYPDPVTKGDPWTCGYGSTHGVHPNMEITQEDAERMLVTDLAVYEAMLEKGLHVKVNQNMWDAMISLAFNIGSRAFLGSTVLRKVNEGNLDEASDAFLMWDKGHTPKGFVIIPGLLKRRKDERKLFMEKP